MTPQEQQALLERLDKLDADKAKLKSALELMAWEADAAKGFPQAMQLIRALLAGTAA